MKAPKDKIKRYLEGTLSSDEEAAFRSTLERSPNLAAEVALQRRMREALSNDNNGPLRAKLPNIYRKGDYLPLSNDNDGPSPWLLTFLLLISLLTVGVYYFAAPEKIIPASVTSPPIDPSPIASDSILYIPIPPINREQPTTSPPGSHNAPQRDPAAPYPPLERLADTVANPIYDFDIYARREGNRLFLTGTLYAFNLPPDSTFLVEVFDNREGGFPTNPRDSFGFRPAEAVEEGSLTHFTQKSIFPVNEEHNFRLPPGRYYAVVKAKADGDFLRVLVVE